MIEFTMHTGRVDIVAVTVKAYSHESPILDTSIIIKIQPQIHLCPTYVSIASRHPLALSLPFPSLPSSGISPALTSTPHCQIVFHTVSTM